MALTVTMPQLGESVTEGTIARWLKQPGELVSKYDSIVEVVTDKVNAEVPAPAEGSMGEHIAKEGEVVAVGQAICTIETAEQGQANSAWHQGDGAPVATEAPDPAEVPAPSGGDGSAAPADGGSARAASQQPEAPPAAAVGQGEEASQGSQAGIEPQAAAPAPTRPTVVGEPAPADGDRAARRTGVHLTPAVRMLVREHDVDLSLVQGTGLGGRISKKDVLDFVQRGDAGGAGRPAAQSSQADPPVAAAAPAGVSAAQAPAPSAAVAANPASQLQPGSGDRLLPLTPIRRSIAEHMVRSKHSAPHAWMMMEVDMSRVARLRSGRRAEFEQSYGAKLTYLPFVARAVCDALRRYPTLNASWTDDGVLVHRDVHLGIAVALEDNLIVPVVRNADRLSVAGLATTMQDLGDRARNNRLKLDEIQGGTFTLNNTGALGTVLTSAIINQPQAAILAMDAVIKRAVVIDDAIAIRPMMNLGLSFDHRINDGLQATRFVRAIKDTLESIDEAGALL